MKKITSILLLSCIAISGSIFAQNKFGHIHSEQLLMVMPETADAEKSIQDYNQMLETQLQTMYGEYQSKAGEFQNNESLMTDIVKEAKINEKDITSADEFKEYAMAILKDAFGDDFDEAKATDVANGLIKKYGEDFGAMVGALQSTMGS